MLHKAWTNLLSINIVGLEIQSCYWPDFNYQQILKLNLDNFSNISLIWNKGLYS